VGDRYEYYDDDDDDYFVYAPPRPRYYAPPPGFTGFVPAPPPGYEPPGYGYLLPPRPLSCGKFRYWNGRFCADARRDPPYTGPR